MYPKPIKREKEKLTAAEFRRKYGTKKLTKLDKAKSVKTKNGKSEFQKKVKEADDWFSRAVRLMASVENYVGHCICCGANVDIRYADCGHFHSRKHYATRWDFNNCGLQKKQHNMRMGEPEVNNGFRIRLIKKIGQEEFDKLEIKRHNLFKPTAFELDLIVGECKSTVEMLLKEKGLKKWW